MSDIVTQLFAAMADASAEIEGAQKDGFNPGFKVKYADLSSVVAAIKPALLKHGLWFRQVMHEREKGVCVETLVCHKAGHELSFGSLFVPATKQDAQGFGSALTYARRYSLMTAFGVCPEDDDGNAACAAKPQASEKPAQQISEAQFATLSTLIEQSGADTKALCTFYKVASIKEMTTDRYEHCVAELNKKLAKKEAS